MPVAAPLIAAFLAAGTIAAWMVSGAPSVVSLTAGVFEFCQTILVRCVDDLYLVRIGLFWTGGLLLAGGLFHATIRASKNLYRSSKAIKGFNSIRAGSIVLIRDGSKTAFTYGLLRPRIYISTGLVSTLTRGELKGVLLHELHHKKRLDPLRFFLFTFIKDLFFYIPAASHLIAGLLALKEKEADDFAAGRMKEPFTLAGALVKVARLKTPAQPAFASGADAASRARRLVEGKEHRHPLPSIKSMLASVLAALVIGFTLVGPIWASYKKECSTDHCAVHINKLGEHCKIHCEVSGAHNHAHGS